MKQLDLEKAFLGRQDVLKSKLTAGRTVAYHPGAVGQGAELNWTAMMQEFLPSRYGVSCAFVVDADSNASDQIDIVIHDRHYSPLLFQDEGGIYIPAESVYAVFEVKQDLSKENIEYAGEKVASVRSLHRTTTDIPHAGGVFAPKASPRLVGGILTLGSTWSPCMGDPFREALFSLRPEQQLDLGCSLTCGAFELGQKDVHVHVETCEESRALIFFALRLFRRLQLMGTVSAIDISRYGRVVWT
jgi:hypothetical protein